MADQTERRVDLVRLPKEERFFEVEAVFGRDASSVFPNMGKEEAAAAGGLSAEAVMEALGARKFISETELDTIRATRGATADDGAVSVDKPLAEILRERKAAKDAEHEEKWKTMKIGKNRPLDAEEFQFLDSVAAAEAAREKEWAELQQAELEAFKAAVRERSAEPLDAPAAAPASTSAPPKAPTAPAPRTTTAPKPLIRAVVKVKPKALAGGKEQGGSGEAREAPAGDPAAKRQRTDGAAEGTAAGGAGGAGGATAAGGLAGLMGAYDSDSEGDG